jgi:formylglycine-generating enzyme required for sulfatase activity
MKRLLNVLPGVIAGILSALLVAGCPNQFSPAPEHGASGQGLVSIHIEDGSPRTLFPEAPVFSRYELQFTPESGQAEKNPESVPGTNPTVTLAAGDWTITAIGYVNIENIDGIPEGEYEAARGSNTITVESEQNHNVSIDIRSGTEAGKGIFSYTLSYPPGVSGAALKVFTLLGVPIKEVNLTEPPASGSFSLDAGYYILRLELEKDGGEIVKVEVIHIYKGLTTSAEGTDYTFTDADFFFAVDTDTTVTAGTMTSYFIASGAFFNMAAVPGGIAFPTGTDDSGTAVVRTPYQIGETEVTWELWETVRTWALDNGYSNISVGQPGSSGSGGGDQQPVTEVSWYSMVVWCNALTEWWNEETGASLVTVYNIDGSPIRDANDTAALDSVTPMPNARGFRLPTSNEWELAARWQGQTDLENSVEMNGYYFTKGDSASGATGPYDNAAATGAVAVNYGPTQEVKSKAPNALNLYDMGGNIAEFCFEWYPEQSRHITRGGCYNDNVNYFMKLGNLSGDYPWDELDILGFRLARTGYKAGEIVLPSEADVPITINFTGPDDEDLDIVNDIIVDITQDPYYEPSWPVLQNNVWYDDSDPVKYYQFYAQAGTAYAITWNDSYQGNASKSADVGVSAYWKATDTVIFDRTDSGWVSPRTFTADRSGIVVLKVEKWDGGNVSGTFAVKYSGSVSSVLGVITQTDSLVLFAPAGYGAYQWIVDNTTSTVTTNTLTLAAGSLDSGPHSVTLIIYKQEGSVQVPYSKTLSFTVVP